MKTASGAEYNDSWPEGVIERLPSLDTLASLTAKFHLADRSEDAANYRYLLNRVSDTIGGLLNEGK